VSAFKIVAATTTLIGLLLGFFERWFKPKALVTEDSPMYPAWLAWIGWIMAALGAVAYIVIDLISKSS
jgi:hypothetical protein